MSQARFQLGRMVATPGALEALQNAGQDAIEFIRRHSQGDWGDLGEEDKRENEFSVGKELRIFSAYHLKDETKIWIITESDRSATTVLLPSEY
jgi:hypothetical protein